MLVALRTLLDYLEENYKSNAVLDILERYMMGQVFRLGDT